MFSKYDQIDAEEFHNNLLNNKNAEKCRQYIFNKRGINTDVVDKFKIGWCPENKNHKMRGRMTTPLYDSSDNVVAFAGRLLREEKPVWWHESFPKKHYVYGLHATKNYIREKKFVIVVEGYGDLWRLYQIGIMNAVAVMGSGLQEDQLMILLRYTTNFAIMLDNDPPGYAGFERTREILKKYSCVFGEVDYGEYRDDPDTFAKAHPEECIGVISNTELKLKKMAISKAISKKRNKTMKLSDTVNNLAEMYGL